jgi:hypothetical protein
MIALVDSTIGVSSGARLHEDQQACATLLTHPTLRNPTHITLIFTCSQSTLDPDPQRTRLDINLPNFRECLDQVQTSGAHVSHVRRQSGRALAFLQQLQGGDAGLAPIIV